MSDNESRVTAVRRRPGRVALWLWTGACVIALLWVYPARAEVRIRAVFDQADAALAIMERLAAGDAVTADHWSSLWQSEGYTRLLEREAAMGRDEGFGEKLEAWLSDPAIHGNVAAWRAAVERFRSFDANGPGNRAAAYLPDGVELEASFYPVIKHTTNTFVYDLDNDPAIFMTVDPDDSALFVESVLAHELHHVGYAQCPEQDDLPSLSEEQRWVVRYLGIFGEGIATLATAGGPLTHPHFYSTPDEWAVWERDVANVDDDHARIETFFLRVLDGRIPAAERTGTVFSFIASPDVPQGPAYTLGWKMAALIERTLGRERLVDAICDPREFLTLYNEASALTPAADATRLPVWSEEFLARLYAR